MRIADINLRCGFVDNQEREAVPLRDDPPQFVEDRTASPKTVERRSIHFIHTADGPDQTSQSFGGERSIAYFSYIHRELIKNWLQIA